MAKYRVTCPTCGTINEQRVPVNLRCTTCGDKYYYLNRAWWATLKAQREIEKTNGQ